MKNSLYIVLALLAGLVIGNFSLKPDLRRAQEEIKSLKGQLSLRGRRDDNLRSVTSMLRVPQPGPAPATNAPAVQKPVEPVIVVTNMTNVVTDDFRTARARAEEARRSFEEQIKSAVELWKTRSELARETFLSGLSATPEQSQVFDQAITNMNAQLGEKIRQWTDYLRQQQEVTPESSMRMVNDLSSTIIEAYDGLDKGLPADWRDKAGPEFQLMDFVNPEVALPFAGVEQALSGQGSRRGQSRSP